MRYTPLPIDPRDSHVASGGFTLSRLHLGTEQRDSVARGLAFVLVLALSCLTIAYAPLAWGDPDWLAPGAQTSHARLAGSHAARSAEHSVPMRAAAVR